MSATPTSGDDPYQALVGLVADRPGRRARPAGRSRRSTREPLEIEVEDRPPGRVTLVEDLLSRMQLRRHGASLSLPGSGPSILAGPMSIAKVEPLTTARALRGPFDYRLPERLGEVGVGTCCVVPFGRQRLLGVVVEVAESSELPPERLAEPIEVLEAGVAAGAGRARPLGRPASTARRRRAGSTSCCRPAPGRYAARPRARTEITARAAPSGLERARARVGLGPVQRRALELLVGAGAEVGGGELAERRRRDATRCGASSGAGWSSSASARCAAARARRRSAPRRPGGARRRPGRGARADRRRASTAAARSCCCTGSPARARPRSTSRPPRLRSSAVAG